MSSKARLRSFHDSLSALALMSSMVLAGCAPASESAQNTSEHDPCATPLAVLATTVLDRDTGQPSEAVVPFEIDPEEFSSTASGGFPVCVVVTNLNEKPRALSSGRFLIDDVEVFGPSAFNQNTPGAMALHELEAGPHELRARLASAPGASVRVQVLMGSAQPLPVGPNIASVLVVPDEETVLSLGGATFTFPPGAVDAPVVVTAIEVSVPYGLGNLFELLPDGMQFNRPVRAEVPYDLGRLPPDESPKEFLARGALKLRHVNEWLDTEVNTESNVTSAHIAHFSFVQNGTPEVQKKVSDVGIEWEILDYNMLVAEIPLNHAGLHVEIKATTAEMQEDDFVGPAYTLRSVTEHVEGLDSQHFAINLSMWAPNDETARKWHGEGEGCDEIEEHCGRDDNPKCCSCPPEHPDCGNTLSAPGIGRLLDTAISTEDPMINFISEEPNYYILISGNHRDGLAAVGLPGPLDEVGILRRLREETQKPGGHAVFIGSDTSLIAGEGDICTEPDREEAHTVVGIGTDCTNEGECLIMLSTIEPRLVWREHPLGKDFCTVLRDHFSATDAIRLDGGSSASMVRNGELRNPKNKIWISSEWEPARRVVNALAVSYTGPVPYVESLTPLDPRLGEKTEFTIRGGNLPDSTAAWIASCVGGGDTKGPSFSTVGDREERKFSCTPRWGIGERDTVIKDSPGGVVLRDDIKVTFIE